MTGDDFERAPCGLATMTGNGRITRTNATLRAWLGYGPGEIEARRFQDLLTVGGRIFHQTHWLPLLQMQGSVAEVQLELVTRDGRVLPVLVNAVRHAAEGVAGVDLAVFVVVDRRKYERELLLARRRAEELLEEARLAQAARADAEAKLRLALDSAGLRVWSVDLATGERRYERGTAALVGLGPDDELPPGLYEACIEPSDRAVEALACAAALDSARRAPYAVEYRLEGRDGVERVVRSTGRAFFDGEGRLERFSGVLEDVTRHRRAEALVRLRELEFRMVAENSPDVIARVDRSERCSYLSPAASAFVDGPLDDLLGRQIEEIALLAPLVRCARSALAGREATCTFSVAGRDGERRELEARLVPERDARGTVVSALAMTRDVTVLLQQEQEARQQALLAEQLMGIVSHDLRNPLNAVLLGSQLLAATPDAPPRPRTVERITSAALRANRLVSDLLDFTRARLGGGLPAHRQPVDLHRLVGECLDEVRLAWPGRGIVHDPIGQGAGSADPDRLAQVVSNLVNNALVYGAPDRPVTATSVVTADTLELDVHNEGPPIPEALQREIFEPMQRGVRASSDHRSVGLGLYIVREIASAHGGTVRVRSVAGEGTHFLVTLPRTAETVD